MRYILILVVGCFLFSNFCFEIKNKPYQFPELSFFPPMPKSKYNPVTTEGVKLGRFLFYDSALSFDSSLSCASCHKQENAFSDSPNKFSKGRDGILMSRNTMPLYNLAWYPSLFWDGRAATIEDQVFHPVRDKNEMNFPWKNLEKRISSNQFYKIFFKKAFGSRQIDSTKIAMAIGQFVRTLISYQSKYDLVIARKQKFTNDEYDGFVLVNDQTKGDCLHCHTTDGDGLGTTLKFSNNGLDLINSSDNFKDVGLGKVTGNKSDNGKFKIPSLRNLVFTAPYMHDGRFATLEEVVDFYSSGVKKSPTIDSKMEFAHQGGVQLSTDEKRKIIAFLKTMSDSTFISKKEFGNPFKK